MMIAITQRVVENQTYPERRDALAHDWAHWLGNAFPDGKWVGVPNQLADIDGWIGRIDPSVLVLSGGNDLGEADDRLRTETRLLEWASAADRPVIGVCRGLQMVNHHHGGSVRRVDGHVGVEHDVTLQGRAGDWLDRSHLRVNSFHRNAVTLDDLADDLDPIAIAKHGSGAPVVEALVHRSRPVLGLQWHPERPHPGHRHTATLISGFLRTFAAVAQ